ncbi:MAG: glycosyltransferase [Candidatus Electrothrix sp. MAN1_4]|nr:glycosyltransferase [Candidatus Electrothrix sp. MAN1_4]
MGITCQKQTTSSLVIHVVTSLDFGGVERHMEIIGHMLAHAQFRILFVAIGDGGAAEKKLRNLGANVVYLGQKTKIPSLGALYALLKLFWREKPVVVHTHGAEANFHGLLAARAIHIPVRIGEEIGIPNHSKFAKRIFRYVYSTAHRVIGVSQAVTDWLVESGEVNEKKTVCILNPVQLSGLRSRKRNDTVFRIGFVGRLEPVKNPKVLLDVFNVLLNKGIPAELWLIGDGTECAAIENRIHKLELQEKIHLLGYRNNPSFFLHQCDIYIQPSLSEGFGLAIVEAMGCGLSVIGTATGGIPEIVRDGVTGWIVEEPNIESLVDALLKAYQLGSDQLFEMGKKAHRSVENRFDPITYLEQLEKLYIDVKEKA